MGMFERLGEKVERFKQEAVAARDDSTDYRCRNCGEGFYGERETCPECGGGEIEPITTETEESAQRSAEPDQKSAETAETEPNSADAETDAEADEADPDPNEMTR